MVRSSCPVITPLSTPDGSSFHHPSLLTHIYASFSTTLFISFLPSFYIWSWALCVIELDGHFHFGFSKSSKISNQKTTQIRGSTVPMCVSAGSHLPLPCRLCHSLTEQSQRANKPQVFQYMDSHTHACPNKHINTQMCTPKARADVINTYATQMRKGPLKEGQGNYSLTREHKHTSTITQTHVSAVTHMTRTVTHEMQGQT